MNGFGWVFKPTWTVLIVLTISQTGWMFPGGAPASTCSTLTPGYPHGTAVQSDPIPYILTVDNERVISEQVVKLQITKKSNQIPNFRGFIISGTTDPFVGTGAFDVTNSDGLAQLLNCDASLNLAAVTHTSRADKSSVYLEWKAPIWANTTREYPVTFQFSVVQTQPVFWVRQEAQVGTVEKQEPPAGNTETPEPGAETPEPGPEKPEPTPETTNSANSKYLSHIHEALIVFTWIASTFPELVMRM